MPGFDRLSQLESEPIFRHHISELRKTKLIVGSEPSGVESVTRTPEIAQNFAEVPAHEMRQEKAVVKLGAPVNGRNPVRRLPERRDEGAHHQLLSQAHARV